MKTQGWKIPYSRPAHAPHAHTGRYLLEFTVINAVLLVLLSLAVLLL